MYAACQWGMVVILAKMGTPEMVGQYALGLAVTAPVIMLANLQLRPILATDTEREYQFGDYLTLRMLTTAAALVVIAGIVSVGGYRRDTMLVILAVGIAKAFEALSDVFYGLLQHHERMDWIATSKLLKGPLSLAALGLGVAMTGSVLWGTVGLALVWMGMLVGYDIRKGATILNYAHCWTALRPRGEIKRLKRLVWLAFPLGLATTCVSLSDAIPRYFLQRYRGEGDLGIFAAMAYLMVVGGLMVNAMGQSAATRLARHYARGEASAFWSLMVKLLGLAAIVGGTGIAVASWSGRELLTLLYRSEYAAHADVLVWIMVAAAITYLASCLGYGITATRAFNHIVLPYAMVTLVGVVVAAVLIPAKGMLGGAWTLCAIGVATCIAPMVAFMTIEYARSAHEPA